MFTIEAMKIPMMPMNRNPPSPVRSRFATPP